MSKELIDTMSGKTIKLSQYDIDQIAYGVVSEMELRRQRHRALRWFRLKRRFVNPVMALLTHWWHTRQAGPEPERGVVGKQGIHEFVRLEERWMEWNDRAHPWR